MSQSLSPPPPGQPTRIEPSDSITAELARTKRKLAATQEQLSEAVGTKKKNVFVVAQSFLRYNI